MRKSKLLKLGIIFTMILGFFVSSTPTKMSAEEEAKGWVTVSGGEVTEKGGTTSITYSFGVTDGPITGMQGEFQWDPTLMEFDGFESDNASWWFKDAPDGYPTEEETGIFGIQNVDGTKASTLYVTLKFKNVLPEGTSATSIPISFRFDDGTSPFEPGVERWVFGGGDFIALQPHEVDMTSLANSNITLNLPISVDVAPENTQVIKGQTEQFTATVTNDDNSGVTWSVDGSDSSIDANGLLSVGAAETASTLTVTATSNKDNTKSATATVTVVDKPTLTLDLTQDKDKVFLGEASTVQLTATPSYTNGTTVTYSLSGALGSSTINATTGELMVAADETATTLTVKAEADNAVADPVHAEATATVDLVELGLSVDPTTATVEKGATQQFSETLVNDLNSDGITWSVDSTESSIDANGLLSVGTAETASTLTVTATSNKNNAIVAIATVTVVEPISVLVTPDTASVIKGNTQAFSATVVNELQDLGVTWSVDGSDSSIDTNGVLSVGISETAETLTVTATSNENGLKVGTATVTVVTPLEVSIALDIANAEMKQGETKALNVTVTNDTGEGVTWEVIGATSADTKIVSLSKTTSGSAVLTVGADEVVGSTLTVKVTSIKDPTKSTTATILVKAKDAPVDPKDPAKPGKPSVAPGNTTTISSSSTGAPVTADTTDKGILQSYMGFAMLGLMVVVISKKRKVVKE